ncbi:unnamed protein product [Medioppia subpectinata]|uniref:Rab-GAP TBC domain-containing protein n=1 Tax=Medioppia subpectinata TaxID=1979941 RepID=A0A7R9KH95_9ACAR|nr:unnamed protein product [Medioppia subpectinata]CAG2103528.1 unnamed protein product [Medioppia subpectinata]
METPIIFLECLPETSEERITKIAELRSKYEVIRLKYTTDPRDANNANNTVANGVACETHGTDNPLSQETTSQWNQYFADSELRSRITQDVIRTFPEMDFFQMTQMQTVMIDILFHFARENPTVDYKQPTDTINIEPFSAPTETSLFSVLGVKLKMINEQIVKRHDYELYNHLISMEIAPQIYGIRWMRLLFGREFQMQDLLVVWDAVFADGFALCDYIFASMLLVIRKLLLGSDYAQCLYHLMRYPSVPDIHYIIHFALHIRDPLNYSEPVGYSSLVMPNIGIECWPIQQSVKNCSPKSYGPTAVRPTTLAVESVDARRQRPESVVRRAPNGKQENELTHISSIDFPTDGESDELKRENQDLRHQIDYCWRHMSSQLDALQRVLATERLAHEDDVMVALAELKKCRDVLKGTLKFSQTNQ